MQQEQISTAVKVNGEQPGTHVSGITFVNPHTGDPESDIGFFALCKGGREVMLEWFSEMETGYLGFEVQRSLDEVNYEVIQPEIVSRSLPESFRAVDRPQVTDGSVWYRVAGILPGGKRVFSEVVEVFIDNGEGESQAATQPDSDE